MAETNIQFDRSNQFGQEIKALLNAYRKVVTDGPIILGAMALMLDGDGSQLAHYQTMVDIGIYPTTTDAKESYAELQSANSKCNTDASVDTVNTAFNQVCAKHGVI